MKDAYQRLRDSVCASRVVHPDDTGWRVGGEGAVLMGSRPMKPRCTKCVLVMATKR